MRTERCRGTRCGKQIVWGRDPDGARIPLDLSAPIYRVTGVDTDGTPLIERVKNVLVSHFSTCVDATQFSGGAKG